MREDAEQDLAALGSRVPRSQCGAEPALQPREDALRLPSLAIEVSRETPLYSAPVGRQRPASAHVPAVECDHGLGQGQRLATEAVVVLRVVAGTAQQATHGKHPGRLAHGRRATAAILARAAGDDGTGDQVGRGVAHGRELRPVAPPAAKECSTPVNEVGADVLGLEPGGVDGDDRRRRDQAGRVCSAKAPFLGAGARRSRGWNSAAPSSTRAPGAVRPIRPGE